MLYVLYNTSHIFIFVKHPGCGKSAFRQATVLLYVYNIRLQCRTVISKAKFTPTEITITRPAFNFVETTDRPDNHQLSLTTVPAWLTILCNEVHRTSRLQCALQRIIIHFSSKIFDLVPMLGTLLSLSLMTLCQHKNMHGTHWSILTASVCNFHHHVRQSSSLRQYNMSECAICFC